MIIEALHKVTQITGSGIVPAYSNFVIDLDIDDPTAFSRMIVTGAERWKPGSTARDWS
ncbi:MAG: hypothetical protein GY815_11840 [Gammaproteobacteria bacterium]|nr:hypothetical protein [Gammaproteobacteria bacterium]